MDSSIAAVDVSTATLIAGVLIANIGGLLAFVINVKVSITRLETKFESAEKDINNLGNLIRKKGE